MVASSSTANAVRAVGTADDSPLWINKITTADVTDALSRGIQDFRAIPTHSIFLGVLYALVVLIAVRVAFNSELYPMIFPIIAGFAILGPVAGIGLYELSRRRETGMETRWWHMFSVLQSPAIGSILGLGIVLMAVFFTWLAVASFLVHLTVGAGIEDTFNSFMSRVFGTSAGFALIIIGNVVGALFALLAFGISVIAFPLILDRHVDMITAALTSIQAVFTNPVPMMLWATIVVAALLFGALPLLLGLAIALPILGHATWHLYRKVMPR